jgi:predicted MFS family arabinose efflux permease
MTENDPAVPAARPLATGRLARLGGEAFASLGHRDYRYLWIGLVFMSAGQWIQQVTLGWLAYDMTGSSVLLGALNGVRTLPFLFTGPLAGVAADRMDRRRLLAVTQGVLAATAAVMGMLVVAGRARVWHLFLFTLITGTAWSFNQPLRQALIPALVPKRDLMNAVALSSAAINVTKTLGPALGGLLIAWFGAGGNFYVQAGAYLGVLVMVYAMRVAPAPPRAEPSSAAADLREGFAYVWSRPMVLSLIGASLVMQVLAMPYQALMPVFQKDVLQVGPEGLGLMLAAPGLGALTTTLLLAAYARRVKRKGVLLLSTLVLLGVCLILFSTTRSLPVALLALTGVGGFQILFLSTNMTMLQLIVPDELRGRAFSLMMLDRGVAPAGALVAGIMAQYTGAPATTATFGSLVILLALVVAWRLPRLRRFEDEPVPA